MNILVCDTAAVWHIGDVIRKLRNERGWTIEELANRAKLGKMTISAIERGEANYRRSTIEKIATALAVSASDLFFELSEVEVKKQQEETDRAIEALKSKWVSEGHITREEIAAIEAEHEAKRTRADAERPIETDDINTDEADLLAAYRSTTPRVRDAIRSLASFFARIEREPLNGTEETGDNSATPPHLPGAAAHDRSLSVEPLADFERQIGRTLVRALRLAETHEQVADARPARPVARAGTRKNR